MKKHTFLFVYLVFFCFVIQGQNTKSPDEIKNLLEIKKELLKNGNSPEFDKQTENYFSDAWKSSINDYGDPPDWNWVSQFGGSGEDHARDIISDTEGNIYVTGSFAGEISVESNSYTSVGHWDAFVAKFQSTGDLIWFKHFSAETGEQFESYGINLDNSGNLFITGYFTGNVILDDINLYGWDVKNGFFAKLDNQGNVLMAQSCDWYDEIGFRIDTDENANIYLLSSISGQPAYHYYTRIMKYDPDGYLLWDNYFNHNFNDLEVFGSSLYFTGVIWTEGYIGDFYFEPVGYCDAFVAKADLELDFDWAVMADHEAFGYSTGMWLYLSQNEEMFITGIYSTDMIWSGNQLEGTNGFIAKFNQYGEFIWASPYTEDDYLNTFPGCICGDNNSAYITYSYSSYPYPTETNVVSQFSASTGDLINSVVIDYEVEAIQFNPADNKIAIAGEQDQLNVISQLNSDMTELWTLQFEGNSAFGDIIGMGIDQYGFMYVYGYASNTLDYFGHTINKGLFLAKQGTTGDVFWLKQFPDAYGSHNLGSYLVTDTLSQNVFITGNFFEPLNIPGITTLTPGEDGSIFIIKYDLNGNYQWAVQEDFYTDQLCLTPDHSGNILISGIFNDTISIGTTNLISAGMRDVFLSKYNSQGSFQWARRAGGEDIEYLGLISTDALNNVYLTGEFTSVNITVHNYAITLNEGDGNILFAKLDPSGNVQWVTSKANSTIIYFDDYCWPTSIQTDDEGYSYIKGWFRDFTYFDNILLTNPYMENPRFSYFIAKFDPDGNTIWANAINEHFAYGFDYNQMSIDHEGNVFFGASIRDTIHFGNEYMYINQGQYDLFVAKYKTSGELEWVKTMESSTGRCWLSSVAVFDESSIFIGGYFNDYLNFGNMPLTSNNQHGFLALIGDLTGITVYERDSGHNLFDIFPNPVKDILNITLSDNSVLENTIVEISDISGKIIYSNYFNRIDKSIEIDVTDFSGGMYFIKLDTGEKSEVKKVVIN
jgi:hypothetical protein